MRFFLKVLSNILTLSYPFWVWWGITEGRLLEAALGLVMLSVIRAFSTKKFPIECFIGLFLAIFSLIVNSKVFLKLYPVVINVTLLAVFASSLKTTPIVEKFARIKEPNLNRHAVAWCKKVTLAWCLFFFINGSVAAFSSFWGSDIFWTLWNGFISYVLMGVMFVGEFILRKLKKIK